MSGVILLKDVSEGVVRIYGRVHRIRATGKICFIVLRDQIYSVQCVVRGEKFKGVKKILPETLVVVTGEVVKLPDHVKSVESTSHKRFEIDVSGIEIIGVPDPNLPFTLEDVNLLYGCLDRNKVMLNTRLDNRAFDLRAPFNNCVFKIQSAVTRLFREALFALDFMEIHSPKIIGSSSEGGAAMFKVDYFGKGAFLAQSPQLYKQMCINSDFKRVMEVGPIFRAENCISHRHLCEFTGLDLEMALTPDHSGKFSYYEIIETFWNTLVHIFDNLKIMCSDQLAYITSIYSFEELKYPSKPLIISFKEGIAMLHAAGAEQKDLEDLSTKNEKILGDLVKTKYGADVFVLDKYPKDARPFYTMISEEDPLYSNSYDVIMRGQEISSGAQRIHCPKKLLERMEELKLNATNFSDYLQSFRYGSPPHGGCGFGLERIVMLYLNLSNIREVSLYPRDPSRSTP
ncbi:MAG: aspartate--tRNA ligase, cytoplasmic [Hyperionvirus sp.]|uniref:Aspartate--tRNA ligase, cytoplasmic n=1 Tax=Hyperionvirus sp. TaxID=2487770 RepID=A0A3G5AAK0_9VIRU|nr:MAG: aspartate--tRNA ligase, cytoplasmic [Hyperionvirus sp.]